MGGPSPAAFFRNKLFFFAGAPENFAAIGRFAELTAFIPTPAALAGDFHRAGFAGMQ